MRSLSLDVNNWVQNHRLYRNIDLHPLFINTIGWSVKLNTTYVKEWVNGFDPSCENPFIQLNWNSSFGLGCTNPKEEKVDIDPLNVEVCYPLAINILLLLVGSIHLFNN